MCVKFGSERAVLEVPWLAAEAGIRAIHAPVVARRGRPISAGREISTSFIIDLLIFRFSVGVHNVYLSLKDVNVI